MPHFFSFLNAPIRDWPIFSTQLPVGFMLNKIRFFFRFYVPAPAPSLIWIIWWNSADYGGVRNRPGRAGFRTDSGSERGLLRVLVGGGPRLGGAGAGAAGGAPGPSARVPGGF